MSAMRNVVVSRIQSLAPGIKEFTFVAPPGEELSRFSAGSHIVIHSVLKGKPHHNPYSLLGSPDDPHWRIAVRRQEVSRGGTAYMHEELKEGDTLRVSEPINLFPLVRLGRKYILVAGGIGVTPILSHAREMSRLKMDFEVHYAVRSAEFLVLSDELRALAPGRFYTYFDSEQERPDFKQLFGNQPLGTHIYVCGPSGMIDACLNAGRAAGWPESHLHSEKFLAAEYGEEFTVVAAQSNVTITVASDTSLLDALEEAGLNPPCLCRGGACGQCEAEVLSCDSEFEHRDIFLTDAEKSSRKKIMPCVSRVKGGTLILNI